MFHDYSATEQIFAPRITRTNHEYRSLKLFCWFQSLDPCFSHQRRRHDALIAMHFPRTYYHRNACWKQLEIAQAFSAGWNNQSSTLKWCKDLLRTAELTVPLVGIMSSRPRITLQLMIDSWGTVRKPFAQSAFQNNVAVIDKLHEKQELFAPN